MKRRPEISANCLISLRMAGLGVSLRFGAHAATYAPLRFSLDTAQLAELSGRRDL